MGSQELSQEFQDALTDRLGSLEELQLLLLAFRSRRSWTRGEAVRRLLLPEPRVEESIQALLASGFLRLEEGSSGGEPCYLYHPASPELGALTTQLADALDRDPLQVLEAMNRQALDRVRTSALRAFASAFVVGRKGDG